MPRRSGSAGSGSGKAQRHLAANGSNGADQHVHALGRDQPARVANHEPIRVLPLRAGRELLRIHAKLRDHLDSARVAFAPEHLTRCLTAHDPVRPLQHIALEPAKRWRIAPIEVLPGKEHGADAVTDRVTAGNGRRQVVRLLIDVEHVRTEVAHDLAQPAEPEEVIAPVQGQRRVDNLVTARRRALGNLAPPLLNPAVR